jgi:hypothetical protein
MKEIFNKMTEMVSDTKDAIMDNLEKAFNPANLMEKFSNATDAAREKIASYTDQLISLSPIIEEIGFKTKSISVDLGLPPSVSFSYEKVKDIEPERRDEILNEHKDKALLGPIVKTLVTADNFQKRLVLGSFKFKAIKITFGLTPAMGLELVPKEEEKHEEKTEEGAAV